MSNSKNDNSITSVECLIARAQKGDSDAINKLIESHKKLVIKIVNKKITESERKYEFFDDLVNAGREGLLTAIKKFDLNKENKLSAYAKWFIRKAVDIERWIQKGLRDKYAPYASTVNKAIHTLKEEGITNPQVSEIVAKSGVSHKYIEEIIAFLNSHPESLEHIDDDGLPYVWIPDKDSLDPLKELEKEEDSRAREREPYKWEFQDEDYGFISLLIKEHSLKLWKKTDKTRYEQFKLDIEAPDRCLRRRNVLAYGSRGMLDKTKLEELSKLASGSEVYERRKLWKNNSQY